jgi:anti-anti-sigma regulatory factor
MQETMPYAIKVTSPEQAVVRFADICDHTRATLHELELVGLVEMHARVVLDLSKTIVMTANWLRWLAGLTKQAKKANKEIMVAGMSESLKESAEVLALKFIFL